MNFKSVLFALVTLPLASCTTTFGELADDLGLQETVAETPAVKVKPELDYSAESPDCATAAARLAENIQVGMALSEVQRLVGKPKFKVPGSWWYASSFSKGGVPVVKFQFGSSIGTKPVKSFSAESDNCRG